MEDISMVEKSDIIEEFIQIVARKNPFQEKMLREWSIEEDERGELFRIFQYFMEVQGYRLEELAQAYTFINNMVLEETYYFIENGTYRNSTFNEVNDIVYQNEEYMKKYMLGLSISDYIWTQHLKMLRWFREVLNDFSALAKEAKSSYLEIGPGFGQYLMKALKNESFSSYLAVDLSPISVEQCRKYLSYCGMDREECQIQKMDFFDFSDDRQFDFIVMGEVLEHVERPFQMLEKIYSLLADAGIAFVTTVINAPAIDHIYLFHSKEQVLEMAEKAGFFVEDYLCVTANDIPLHKAEKRNRAIDIAMVLTKNKG